MLPNPQMRSPGWLPAIAPGRPLAFPQFPRGRRRSPMESGGLAPMPRARVRARGMGTNHGCECCGKNHPTAPGDWGVMERQDISRVLLPPAIAAKPQPLGGGSYLSGAIVADRLKRYTKTEQEKDQPLPLDLAPNRGLPSRHLSMSLVRSYRTFAPLPKPRSPARSPLAVSFCGTILTIARTGHYPASLVLREPGLSSGRIALRQPARNCLAYLSISFSLRRTSAIRIVLDQSFKSHRHRSPHPNRTAI
jgi:hypothetical protein